MLMNETSSCSRLDYLTALTPVEERLSRVTLEEPPDFTQNITAALSDLVDRRLQKRAEALERFCDAEHVKSLGGDAAFVRKVVYHPHFLGSLSTEDVKDLLKGQNPFVGIVYIDEEWIPTNLFDSTSPKDLVASLKVSFLNQDRLVVDCKLEPGQGVEEQCSSFLEVDPAFTNNIFFKGFAQYNLLRMQHARPEEVFGLTALLTREELDGTITKEDWRPLLSTDRYSNVLPYGKNCVQNPDINGSYVQAGSRLFIACQGPRDATALSFWQTVASHRSETVIAIGPALERETEKFSEKYFMQEGPFRLEDGTTIEKSDLESAITWGEKKNTHWIITRTFILTLPNGTTRTVTHHHCPTWQDMKGGDIRVLTELVKRIEATQNPHSPILTHCSAGIGRTGTLLGAWHLYQQHMAHPNMPLCPLATIMQLRHQRYGAVQTPEQIDMLFRYINQI